MFILRKIWMHVTRFHYSLLDPVFFSILLIYGSMWSPSILMLAHVCVLDHTHMSCADVLCDWKHVLAVERKLNFILNRNWPWSWWWLQITSTHEMAIAALGDWILENDNIPNPFLFPVSLNLAFWMILLSLFFSPGMKDEDFVPEECREDQSMDLFLALFM